MSTQNVRQPVEKKPVGKVQDLPGCIKYVLLFFLLLLLAGELYAGEFKRFPDWGWITWFILLIKLILIAVLIWLIKVQKDLKCEITSPATDECVAEENDAATGTQVITVKGTAGGSVFGHYTLGISGPYPYSVTYPAGGGSVHVTNGKLGTINTTALDHGTYTVTLTVFPSGAGSPKVCQKTFTLLKVAVYITRMDGIPAVPNCFDEDAELVSGMHIVSLGGSISLEGSAYVFECVDRKVERLELRYCRVVAPGPGPSQPANDTPTPGDWPPGQSLHNPLVYDATKYWPWTEVGEAPTNLINDWGTIHVGLPSPNGADYPLLQPGSWYSDAVTGVPGGGRYSILLIVTDTAGHLYYDMQRCWVDNWPIQCDIVKFQKPGTAPNTWDDIPPCTDLLLSWKKLRIIGIAWDALIDKDFPATAPNDNFDQYGLKYNKQFVGATVDIPITPTPDYPLLDKHRRVPDVVPIVPGPLPTPADAKLLAEWDLTTLDAGPSPTGQCDAPLPPGSENKLYHKCACTYDLTLSVNDRTVSNETGYHGVSKPYPIKIVNDL